jgi:hypothetical protein
LTPWAAPISNHSLSIYFVLCACIAFFSRPALWKSITSNTKNHSDSSSHSHAQVALRYRVFVHLYITSPAPPSLDHYPSCVQYPRAKTPLSSDRTLLKTTKTISMHDSAHAGPSSRRKRAGTAAAAAPAALFVAPSFLFSAFTANSHKGEREGAVPAPVPILNHHMPPRPNRRQATLH